MKCTNIYLITISLISATVFKGISAGQCKRLTSFPPRPLSGCCGQEVVDDDPITDRTPRFSAHDINPWNRNLWAQPSQYGLNKLWKLKDTRSKRAVAVEAVRDTAKKFERIKVSGGSATELYQYPWTVRLLTTFDYGYQQKSANCGGSLISAKYVLSAGHCVFEEGGVVNSVEVYLAEYDKRTFPRDCKVSQSGRKCIENIVMYAEDIKVHPQYEKKYLLNDIALIRLRGTAPYTEFIRPICLPTFNVDEPQFSNSEFAVSGWGRNGQYESNVKQTTIMHLVNENKCKSYYPYFEYLTNTHLCAVGYKGEDTCPGDSGGPLMMLHKGRYYLAGVVSGKRNDVECGTAVPSLYTNVYHYLDWIRSNIRN